MTRTRPLPYLFLMSGTRKTSCSTGEFAEFRFPPIQAHDEQRSCQTSAAPIRRVAPWRNQKRHVEMAFGLAHRKPQRYQIEKQRTRHRPLPSGKVIRDAEGQFVTADRPRPAANQRLIGAAILVGPRACHDAACAKLGQFAPLDRLFRRTLSPM